MDNPTLIPVLLAAIALVAWLLLRVERTRLAGYVRERGWTLVKLRWLPLRSNWLYGGEDHVYRVTYLDRRSRLCEADARTLMYRAIRLSDERLAGAPAGPNREAD